VDVGGVSMIKAAAAGSDWDSGSFSSSGQSPLNGQHHQLCTALFVFVIIIIYYYAVGKSTLVR